MIEAELMQYSLRIPSYSASWLWPIRIFPSEYYWGTVFFLIQVISSCVGCHSLDCKRPNKQKPKQRDSLETTLQVLQYHVQSTVICIHCILKVWHFQASCWNNESAWKIHAWNKSFNRPHFIVNNSNFTLITISIPKHK